jgi:hypothetical protein
VIYLVGGAPRTGKTILGQRISAKLKIGWVSTDLLMELLRVKGDDGVKTEWNAAPEAIAGNAAWFFEYLERFVWGVSSKAPSYVIEGVDFLPAQVAQLSTQYQIRSVFLGRSKMTLDQFDQFPGRSRGYALLPEELRRQIVLDIPLWSAFVRQKAVRFGYPYIDMVDDFPSRLNQAENALTTGTGPEERGKNVWE